MPVMGCPSRRSVWVFDLVSRALPPREEMFDGLWGCMLQPPLWWAGTWPLTVSVNQICAEFFMSTNLVGTDLQNVGIKNKAGEQLGEQMVFSFQ